MSNKYYSDGLMDKALSLYLQYAKSNKRISH